jgi:NADH:ubiquinone oxidoreductase subunit E
VRRADVHSPRGLDEVDGSGSVGAPPPSDSEKPEDRARAVIGAFFGAGRAAADRLVPVLLDVQSAIGFIPPGVVEEIAERVALSAVQVEGVLTSHRCFSTRPRGRFRIRVCGGADCRMAGSGWLLDATAVATGAEVGGTSEDGLFSVELASCLDCCARAPAIAVGDEVHGPLTPESLDLLVRRLRSASRQSDGRVSGDD